ncbi:hypothetical protein [Dysgonomonas sp. 511]|uniref:hypothetical protein n=1 Tax=Dysgonomonas sp. 511 TaxID=2302930 RepID=UPI0013D44C78|nr:hypothetical protein [Dysgonomonas sp. 511]NDV79477.1 hypothetical protein [Dysgonomonas sp. 511]
MRNNIYGLLAIKLLILLFVAMLSTGATAQTYPVQTNVYIMPPHGKHLNDYYTTSKEKLVVSLLNRDQQKPVLEVRLRMTITASNGLKIQSKEEVNYPTITLDAGIPTRLTQEDLAPYFLNVNTSGYLDKGKLPDGMVEFTFQAIEKYTGKVLSAPSSGRVWLSSQKPPILRQPSNNDYIAFRDPMNLKFQWEPRHKNISQIEYEFELRELPDYGAAPQSSFMYAPIIHQERLLYTYLVYDMMMPPLDPNKLYGWRVRAIAKDGVDEINLFENSGYSEIYWFRTQTLCGAPSGCTATLHDRRMDIEWLPADGNNEFVVQYRPKYGTSAEWESVNTYNQQTSLYDMKRGMTYEYRVGGICTSGQPVFSEVGEISVPAVDSARLARCGIMPVLNLENKEPLPELRVGDVVMLSDYPMTVTKVSGANGNFSGEGWVPVNWLLETKWAVEFNNIRVNTDYRLIGGSVRAQYDKDEGNIAKLDDITEGGMDNTKNGITRADIELDFTIPDNPVFRYDEATGEVVVYTTDGQEVGKATIPKNNEGKAIFPVTVKDKEGNLYKLEEEKDVDGNPATEIRKDADGKESQVNKINSTYLGKEGTPLQDGSFDKKNISQNALALVTFDRGEGNYAFDTWLKDYVKISKIVDKYEHLANGQDQYHVPWKWLPVGGSDVIEAKVDTIKGRPGFDPAKVVFITPQGTEYKGEYNASERVFTVNLVGGAEGDVQELYALYRLSADAYHTLGKINIVSYRKQSHKLVLVEVNGYKANRNAVRSYLDKVYNPVGVTWVVDSNTFSYEGDLSDMFKEGSKLLSAYNDKMKALQNAYKEKHSVESGTTYLFILGKSGGSEAGFMPRGKQFGYIFTDKLSEDKICHNIAHELGHGKWKLSHTFDSTYGGVFGEKDTDNLMSYSGGNHLAKWQWDVINDPAWFSNPLDGDDKGMWTTDGHFYTLDLLGNLLGLPANISERLGFFSEYPDSEVHNIQNMEEKDTWMIGEKQQRYHALTGGYHGVEVAITTYALMKSHKKSESDLLYLYHRFGDDFAHFNIEHDEEGLTTPTNLLDYAIAYENYVSNWIDKNIKTYPKDTDFSKYFISTPTGNQPLSLFPNYVVFDSNNMSYISKYTKDELVRGFTDFMLGGIHGSTFASISWEQAQEEILKILPYAIQNKFKMYGEGQCNTFTLGHAKDGSAPDQILGRKNIYLHYLDQLIQLLNGTYSLNITNQKKTEIKKKFEEILNHFSSTDDREKRIDGILAYENAKLLNKNSLNLKVYIPIKYPNWKNISKRAWLYYTTMGDFDSDADKIKDVTISYINKVDADIIDSVNVKLAEEKESKAKYWEIDINFKKR